MNMGVDIPPHKPVSVEEAQLLIDHYKRFGIPNPESLIPRDYIDRIGKTNIQSTPNKELTVFYKKWNQSIPKASVEDIPVKPRTITINVLKKRKSSKPMYITKREFT